MRGWWWWLLSIEHGGGGVNDGVCERPSSFVGPDGAQLLSCGWLGPFGVVVGSHHSWEALVSLSRGW